MGVLQDKAVIITGGGRGIGAACAMLFAQEGAKVMINSKTAAELEQTVEQVKAAVPDAVIQHYAGDISDEAAVKLLFAESYRSFGPLSILVNCAAIIGNFEFIDSEVSAFDKIMAVNIRGTMLCGRQAFRQMRASGKGGAIINISSLGGIRNTTKFAGYSAYSASKAAVIGLTESMAVEGKPYGIRVNAVAPGAVATLMLKSAAPSLKTSTTPEHIAKTLLFLSDDKQSGKITGTVIEIHSND